MLQVKADNMAVFIAKEKEDIAALWDALFYSDEYRSMQGLLQSNEATEEVLEAHEQERLRLTQEIADKQPILVRLAKYFALLEEMQQLEASANDPSRLLGKAQRGDPGRLLREEKSRKRVAVQKPKVGESGFLCLASLKFRLRPLTPPTQLEQDLLTAIPAWEEQYQQPFLVNGTRFVEDLQARIEAEEAAKPPSKVLNLLRIFTASVGESTTDWNLATPARQSRLEHTLVSGTAEQHGCISCRQ